MHSWWYLTICKEPGHKIEILQLYDIDDDYYYNYWYHIIKRREYMLCIKVIKHKINQKLKTKKKKKSIDTLRLFIWLTALHRFIENTDVHLTIIHRSSDSIEVFGYSQRWYQSMILAIAMLKLFFISIEFDWVCGPNAWQTIWWKLWEYQWIDLSLFFSRWYANDFDLFIHTHTHRKR